MHIGDLSARSRGPPPRSTRSTQRTVNFISDLHNFLLSGRDAMRRMKYKNEKQRNKRERPKIQADVRKSPGNPYLVATERTQQQRQQRSAKNNSSTRSSQSIHNKRSETERTKPKTIMKRTHSPVLKTSRSSRPDMVRSKSLTTKSMCPTTSLTGKSFCATSLTTKSVCPTCLRRLPNKLNERPKSEENNKRFIIRPLMKNEPVQVTVSRGKRDSKLAVNLKIEPHKSAHMPFVTIGQIKQTPKSSNYGYRATKQEDDDLGLMICIHDAKKSNTLQRMYAGKSLELPSTTHNKKVLTNSKLSYRRIGVVCSFSKLSDQEHNNKKSSIKNEKPPRPIIQRSTKTVSPIDKRKLNKNSSPVPTSSRQQQAFQLRLPPRKPFDITPPKPILQDYCCRGDVSALASSPHRKTESSEPIENLQRDSPLNLNVFPTQTQKKIESFDRLPSSPQESYRGALSVHFTNLPSKLNQACQTSSHRKCNCPKSKLKLKSTKSQLSDRKSRRDVAPNRVIVESIKAVKSKTLDNFNNPFYEQAVPIKVSG